MLDMQQQQQKAVKLGIFSNLYDAGENKNVFFEEYKTHTHTHTPKKSTENLPQSNKKKNVLQINP